MVDIYLPSVQSQSNRALHGLGLAHGIVEDAVAVAARWVYNWGPYLAKESTEGVEYVPMIWGRHNVGYPVEAESPWLLGFNEPDQTGHSPWEAALLWRQIEGFYPEKKLVSPAPSHVNPTWLMDFYVAYQTEYGQAPRLDALAIHTYLPFVDAIQIIGQIIAYARQWGVAEVWVTEFALPYPPEQRATGMAAQLETMRLLIDWFNDEKMITRYAWFTNRVYPDDLYLMYVDTWMTAALCNPDGSLTSVGALYAELGRS